MRTIDMIIIHCSATRADCDYPFEALRRDHLERGFTDVGYHFYIRKDGRIADGRPVALAGAHALGWNAHSIGICYEGGLDAHGLPADTRTEAQRHAMRVLIRVLRLAYPTIAHVMGHRDTGAPKACPCFDVATDPWCNDPT